MKKRTQGIHPEDILKYFEFHTVQSSATKAGLISKRMKLISPFSSDLSAETKGSIEALLRTLEPGSQQHVSR